MAAEADWPDACRVNTCVRGRGSDESADEALCGFQRFPSWMWRNTVVLGFVEWLREFNASSERKAGFYGLDLYSMYSSMEAVVNYLERVDPDAAARAAGRTLASTGSPATVNATGTSRRCGRRTHARTTSSRSSSSFTEPRRRARAWTAASPATSWTRCGRYIRAGVDPNFPGYPTEGLGEIRMSSCEGDSGGPIYASHGGFGIFVALTQDYRRNNVNYGYITAASVWCSNNTSYYQGLNEAQNVMNVDILLATSSNSEIVDPIGEVLSDLEDLVP